MPTTLFEANLKEEELYQLSNVLAIHLSEIPILLLNGNLGAGKTTLVKKVAEHLGAKNIGTSPTFSLVNEYHLPESTIFHLDLYRLNSEAEAYDIGLEEILDSGNICFIEWPDVAQSLTPEPHLSLTIEHAEGSRLYRLEQMG